MEKEIILSDESPCTIRVMDIFALDPLRAKLEPPGPFYEEIEMAGTIVKKKYIPPSIPPQKPTVSKKKTAKNSPDWHAWLEYELYFAYLAHRQEEERSMSIHVEDVKTHILSECVSEEDWTRIVTKEDWYKIHRAAHSAQLTREDLAQALASTFPGDV